jgi:predicted O-methyltransferase YrrM
MGHHLLAARQERSWPCDDGHLHSHVEHLARALSADLFDDFNRTKYDVHGLFGIFAQEERIAVGPKAGRLHNVNYNRTKTFFITSRLCRLAQSVTRPVRSVCEVGFCAGLSTLLLLEAAPGARVTSFDLGDLPWSRAADRLIRRAYPAERFPGVVFGDAAKTIARANSERPLRCDAVFVDGDKTYDGRLKSIAELRAVSYRGAAVFMDEVTSLVCMNGTFAEVGGEHERHCRALNDGYYASVRAYNHAYRLGWLTIDECVWPKHYRDRDGSCLGRFL